MKLRLHNQSFRVRLSQSEVARLNDTGVVEMRTQIGAQALVVRVRRADAEEPLDGPLTARLANQVAELIVDHAAARVWAGGDQVGLSHDQPTQAGEPLRLLLEKDFACLKPRAEDPDDLFPNPAANPPGTADAG